MVAFVGCILLEDRVKPSPVQQYVSAMSRCHKYLGFPSSSKLRLVILVLHGHYKRVELEFVAQKYQVGI